MRHFYGKVLLNARRSCQILSVVVDSWRRRSDPQWAVLLLLHHDGVGRVRDRFVPLRGTTPDHGRCWRHAANDVVTHWPRKGPAPRGDNDAVYTGRLTKGHEIVVHCTSLRFTVSYCKIEFCVLTSGFKCKLIKDTAKRWMQLRCKRSRHGRRFTVVINMVGWVDERDAWLRLSVLKIIFISMKIIRYNSKQQCRHNHSCGGITAT